MPNTTEEKSDEVSTSPSIKLDRYPYPHGKKEYCVKWKTGYAIPPGDSLDISTNESEENGPPELVEQWEWRLCPDTKEGHSDGGQIT